MQIASNPEKSKVVMAAIADVDNGKTKYSAAKAHGLDVTEVIRAVRFRNRLNQCKPLIEEFYPTTDSREMAEMLECTVPSLHKMASILGVSKCRKLVSRQQSNIIKRSAHGFKSGKAAVIKTDPAAHKKYVDGVSKYKQSIKFMQLVAGLNKNIEALNAAEQFALAKLTSMIVERMKSREINLDFLTIRDER